MIEYHDYLKKSSPEIIGACVFDFAQNRVLSVNEQLRLWIGEQAETISMEQLLALVPALESARSRLADEVSENEAISFPRRATLQRSAAPPIQVEVQLIPMETGQRICHLLLIQPCEEPYLPNSYTDVVTGLPDRRALEDWRRHWLHKNPDKPIPHALLFLDLDDFKPINDQHGHACGDRILAILAERWQKSLRGEDLVVRYGGDEFVILLVGIQTAEAAMPVIERIKACTSAPIQIEQTTFTITVSIGFALADDIDVPLEDLLATADRAMYAQKGQA